VIGVGVVYVEASPSAVSVYDIVVSAVNGVDPMDSGLLNLTTAGTEGGWTFSMRIPLGVFVVFQLKTTIRPPPTLFSDTLKNTTLGATVKTVTAPPAPLDCPLPLETDRETKKVPGLTKMCVGSRSDE
jgi:hypothetical protein